MQGSPKRSRGRKRGPKPFRPTRKHRADVVLFVAGGLSEPAIAREVGVCQNTLRKHFAVELAEGRERETAANLRRLRNAADAGNVAAMKHLDGKLERAAQPPAPKDPQPRVRPMGKKEVAERDAIAAGTDSDWGEDLAPPQGLPN